MLLRGKAIQNPIPMLFSNRGDQEIAQEPIEIMKPEVRDFERAAEESVWIRKVQEGDIVAFDSLMTRYRERALRLATHILRNEDEAEDVVQEAFLRIYAQIKEFRGESRFYTWFYRIVVRCSLNRMRIPYRKREQIFLAEVEYSGIRKPKESEEIEARLLVNRLMEQISPPLRAALVLRELEGLDYLDIAETLEIPVGTVRSRLNTARDQFRVLYQGIQKETQDV